MNATSCYCLSLTFIHWLLISIYLHSQFWHSRRSRILKQPPEVFLKVLQISQESTCVGVSFFTKFQAFRPATILKRDSYTGVFLWNSRNSEEHLFWKTSERLLLCIDCFIIYWFLQSSTVHDFHFYKGLLYYAIKTIELLTREAVCFGEVFHWTKFLAFES